MNTESKYYLKKPVGYSPCILGNNKHGLRPSASSVLPNCVGFAVGYFNELLDLESIKYLGNWKPSYFMTGAKKQGLKTGKEPKKNAVIVWKTHVAILLSETKVIESNYYVTEKPIIYEKSYSSIKRMEESHEGFLGYIYLPDPSPSYTEYVVKAGDTLTKISKISGLSIGEIMEDNPIIKNKNLIRIGWKLKLRRMK